MNASTNVCFDLLCKFVNFCTKVKLAKLRAQMLDALRREVSSSFSRLLEQVDECGACANNNKGDLDHIQQCVTCAGKYFGMHFA